MTVYIVSKSGTGVTFGCLQTPGLYYANKRRMVLKIQDRSSTPRAPRLCPANPAHHIQPGNAVLHKASGEHGQRARDIAHLFSKCCLKLDLFIGACRKNDADAVAGTSKRPRRVEAWNSVARD